MKFQDIFEEFTKKFRYSDTHPLSRGIGIEMELPVITQAGEAISTTTIHEMFVFLESEGFQLEKDDFSDYIISASRINQQSAANFDYKLDTVMTDAGSGVIELVLAPQNNLHTIQASLAAILSLLVSFFDSRQCKMLGYGVQPLTAPSRALLMPKERYLFYEKFSPNNLIPKSEGADAHLLTITASNQCHIDIGQEEAISALNVLNALSGLQIMLNANSPIWRGQTDPDFKANREIFWEYCYPDRHNQVGIPPEFRDLKDYIRYMLAFKPMLVERERLLQLLNKATFKDYLLNKSPAIGQDLKGEQYIVQPRVEDIHYLNTFCYFDARLVPKLGTIESRMCCQQPPDAPLAPTALTLGLLSNLSEAQQLAATYPREVWKQIRLDAIQDTFNTTVEGASILSLLTQFLDCAKQGLLQRNQGEEIFLAPLYERLARRQSPADEAIAIFETEGFESFLNHFAFSNSNNLSTSQSFAQAAF